MLLFIWYGARLNKTMKLGYGGTETVVLSRERYQIEGTTAYCVAHKRHMKRDSMNITQVLAGSWV